MNQDKKQVHAYWNKSSCGEDIFLEETTRIGYLQQSKSRYEVEPYILDFVEFERYKGLRVLEIGVGLGAEHQKFAEAGATLFGIDLTNRAIDHTKRRFRLFGLDSQLSVGDAENLPFKDNCFDLVYSWGVLHHTPDTKKAISEVFRVLKAGGEAKIMLYHKASIVGYLLWTRYALAKLKPMTSLSEVFSQYLESPGTQAFSISEAKELLKQFKNVKIKVVLSPGDLLMQHTGQDHAGLALSLGKRCWPRKMIRRCLSKNGLFMLVSCTKEKTQKRAS